MARTGTPVGTAVPVTGTGPGGKVTPQDVMNRIQQAHDQGIPLPPGFEVGPDGKVQWATDWQTHFADIMQWAVPIGLSATMVYGAASALGSGAAAGGLGPSTPGNIAATTAAEGAPDGIAATSTGVAGAAGTGAAATGAGPGGSSILGTIGKASSILSPILGGAAKNAQGQTNIDNQLNVSRDRNALARYEDQITAPSTILKGAVGASKVANWTPPQINWGGPGSGLRGQQTTVTGGYANPNLINGDTKSLADKMTHDALVNHLNGTDQPPALSTPSTSTGASILGGAALGSSIVGGLGTLLRRSTSPVLPIEGYPSPYDNPEGGG